MRKRTTWAAPLRLLRLDNLPGLFPLALVVCCSLLILAAPGLSFAKDQGSSQGENQQSEGGISVMQSFNKAPARERQQVIAISDHEKGVIMFVMGAALLVAVVTTASLGIAMVLHGKEVFLAHMISAGISVFLAIVHAVVAVVWFFPF